MRLVDLVQKETGAPFERIMLLRHSNDSVKLLRECGGTEDEYTSIQPIDSKYDFAALGIEIVVVIVFDQVFGVYRVGKSPKEGTTFSLSSEAYQRFELARRKPPRKARRFQLKKLASLADGHDVTGWKGKEISTPLRSTGNLFWNIEVAINETSPIDVETEDLTDDEIEAAIRDNRLRIGIVATSDTVALTRQRRGQDILRTLTLRNYGNRCALCDISDEQLLRASHVVGWAEREECRGYLSNVICLCVFHDALFEYGYWSLDERLGVIRRKDIVSKAIRRVLPLECCFREPESHPVGMDYIRHHRMKHGLTLS